MRALFLIGASVILLVFAACLTFGQIAIAVDFVVATGERA